jgi:glycosyltransferase involved in cell wall biosynthesis
MKILHVLPAFYPTRGGIETLVSELANELREKHSVESVFMIPRFWKYVDRVQNVENSRVYGVDILVHKEFPGEGDLLPARKVLESIRQIDSVLNIEKPDLIHIHGVYTLFKLSSHLARKYKIPFIHHVHGELPIHGEQELLPILNESPCLVVVSQEVADNLKTHLPNKDSLIIRNAIKIRNLERIAGDGYRISLIGRLEPQKGFHVALDAISRLKSNIENLEIHIVGIGDHLFLQALVEELNIAHLTYFHGRCSGEETMEIIRSSDLVVVPSTDTEGFSLIAAEAASMSVPVVASKVGGLSTTIVDGVTGTLVPPSDVSSLRDAIDFYISNPETAKAHGLAAKSRIQDEFSIDKYAQRMKVVYDREIIRQRSEFNVT